MSNGNQIERMFYYSLITPIAVPILFILLFIFGEIEGDTIAGNLFVFGILYLPGMILIWCIHTIASHIEKHRKEAIQGFIEIVFVDRPDCTVEELLTSKKKNERRLGKLVAEYKAELNKK